MAYSNMNAKAMAIKHLLDSDHSQQKTDQTNLSYTDSTVHYKYLPLMLARSLCTDDTLSTILDECRISDNS